MTARPRLTLLALLLAPALAAAQVPPDKAVSTMKVADGLQIELFAAEPMLINPTSIDVDHKGRVWVCEAVNYRRVAFNRPILRPEGDRIVILEDTTGSGKADKATVFYQGKDLIAPLGVAVAKEPTGPGYKVFVCQSPDILVFEDKNGVGKADGPPKKLLSGFGGFDHDHGVHGIFIGPDGKLYFTVGDTGVRNLQSSDGKGRKWTSNSTDCRAGTVWRCDLDGTNLELLAHNFRNDYECCVDSFGTIWLSDNDDDGSQQTRICYVMPGGDYGYHPRGPGQSHWHEEQPGIVHKALRTGFGSPTGIQIYEGTLLPEKYRGQILHTDAGPREFRCFHVKPKGAGYELEKENLVTSSDTWFRLSDVCVAPDGSVMLADWYDPGVGGHGMGDWTRGRIYRVTPKGHQGYKVPAVKLHTPEGIAEALGSPNRAARYMAIAALRQMPKEQAVKALLAGRTVADKERRPELLARVIWQAAALGFRHPGDINPFAFWSALCFRDGADDRFRQLYLRIEARLFGPVKSTDLLDMRKELIDQATPAVRREALLALRETSPDEARSAFYDLAKKYDGGDHFYRAALNIACGTDKARRDAILADFDKHFPDLDDKTLDLVWELRPPKVLATLGKRLTDKSLTPARQARVLDILAGSDDPSAGKAVLDLLHADVAPEVVAQARASLERNLPGKWKALRQAPELTAAIDERLKTPQTMPSAFGLIAAAERTDRVKAVAAVTADRQRPADLRLAAVAALGQLPGKEAVATLEDALTLDPPAVGEAAVRALGEQLRRPGNDGADAALKALQLLAVVRDHRSSFPAAAINALAATRPGTAWLLDAVQQDRIEERHRPEAVRLLRNSPFPDLRNKAAVAFPPPGKINPKKLPAIASLVTRKGDAARGQKVLAASLKGDAQCLKCHTVLGSGGQIGPDLSMIGKKASRENLFESILYPSKAIADQYLQWQITTTKGLALQGLIVAETPEAVVLRDGNGKDTRINVKNIESRKKLPTSIMPEDIVAFLSEDELVDLVEYLLTLKTPSLTMDYWHIVGPFANGDGDKGLDVDHGPEKGLDPKAEYPGKSGKVTWRTVHPDATGYVDLAAHYGTESTDIVSYLYREIESPADQEATLLLGHDDACKVFVNGKLVYTSRDHLAARPDQARVKVTLTKGVNRVLFKITNGQNPHGLYFTVLAEQELKRVEGR
jgi:putative membrane-bound dehydrogenase-like protein